MKRPQDRKQKLTPAPEMPADPRKAVVAWIHPGQASAGFTISTQGMFLRDMTHERHLVGSLQHWSGANISDARNYLTGKFLDEYTADFLLWIDADMTFEPDALHQLIESADPDPESETYAPIVGGLCFGEDEDGLFPTVYQFSKTAEGELVTIRVRDYPDDSLLQVAATGAAFILIHRSVLEAIRVRSERGDPGFSRVFPFFQEGEMGLRPVGEDITFCGRAGACGFPIFINTSVKIGHHKSHILTAEKFRKQQGAKVQAPPATEHIDVIVPTLWRPQNAKRFVESVTASTGLARVFAACDDDDVASIEAWSSAGAEVVTGGVHTFAEKCNAGYAATSAPWVLIVGDDVVFRPGWWDEAFHAAQGDRFDVVGTNDLGTKRVQAGEHATHIVLRRNYVDEVGGGWDGPGVLAHEGYAHWFVDDEIVEAAKQRGTWVGATRSVIEHFHPLFGKADEDDTYLEGQKNRFEDEVLFRKRLAENGG